MIERLEKLFGNFTSSYGYYEGVTKSFNFEKGSMELVNSNKTYLYQDFLGLKEYENSKIKYKINNTVEIMYKDYYSLAENIELLRVIL